jgi:uncharacterized protein
VKLEQSFEVQAPLERVWNALIDVEYVAPCLPGANITGRDEEGAYRGTFTVKLGPTTAAYNGVLRVGELDEGARRATLHARGTDKRGQGGATATIVNTVVELDAARTRVDAKTDFTITGRLARFGRGGMIEDISNRLLRDFSTCLQAKLAADEQATTGTPAPDLAAAPAPPTGAPAPGVTAEAPAPSTPMPSPPTATPAPAPAPAPAKPVGGFSLFFSVLWERIKKRVAAMRTTR